MVFFPFLRLLIAHSATLDRRERSLVGSRVAWRQDVTQNDRVEIQKYSTSRSFIARVISLGQLQASPFKKYRKYCMLSHRLTAPGVIP